MNFGAFGLNQRRRGSVVMPPQVTQVSAVSTGTTLIPNDNTIPQITEGDQILTLTAQFSHRDSAALIEVNASFANDTGGGATSLALFQDGAANAIAAQQYRVPALNVMIGAALIHYIPRIGKAGPVVFTVRLGHSVASTTTFNGASGVGLFGGVLPSMIRVTEHLPQGLDL